jgi:CDP-glucose 4,6-dehydratase
MRGGRLDRRFWAGRTVLITGHTGFKGAWLCMALEELGCSVSGLALAPDAPSLFQDAALGQRMAANFTIDIEDGAAVMDAVQAVKPEIVIHFAAQSLVRRAYREPRRTFGVNVMGAVNLFEALRSLPNVQAILTATTDKAYLNLETGVDFREGDPLGGVEPYSASKAGAEHVVSAYRASYFAERGVAMPVCRAGNVIGGGDWSEDRLIPDAIRAAMRGESMTVRSPGSVRPWQHVLDALVGYLLLIEHSLGNEGGGDQVDPSADAWNFGPATDDEQVAVQQICEWMAEFWPETFSWSIEAGSEQIHEAKMLMLDSQKALQLLEWQPAFTARAAVLESLSWYSKFLSGEDAYDISLAAIRRHPAFQSA